MKESPAENPNPRKEKLAVLKAAILGAVVFAGITLFFILWAAYKNYPFGYVSPIYVILGIPPFFVSEFIVFISKFFGFSHLAFVVTDTRAFSIIVNALFGALIGYWIGCESRNRKRS
jgi:hypothetical protein